jgi:hypothetical protein
MVARSIATGWVVGMAIAIGIALTYAPPKDDEATGVASAPRRKPPARPIDPRVNVWAATSGASKASN